MGALQKEKLLQEVDEVLQNSSNYIEISVVIRTLSAVLFVFVLLLPKIYLSKNIYYESAKISMLTDKYYSLKEENFILANKIEKIKFHNRVTH